MPLLQRQWSNDGQKGCFDNKSTERKSFSTEETFSDVMHYRISIFYGSKDIEGERQAKNGLMAAESTRLQQMDE